MNPLFLAAGSDVLPSDRSENTSYAARFAENSNCIFTALQDACIPPVFPLTAPFLPIRGFFQSVMIIISMIEDLL